MGGVKLLLTNANGTTTVQTLAQAGITEINRGGGQHADRVAGWVEDHRADDFCSGEWDDDSGVTGVGSPVLRVLRH